jgi:hypothetical protein
MLSSSPILRSIGDHKWEAALQYLEANPNKEHVEVSSHRVWNDTFTEVIQETRYLLCRTTHGYERRVVRV